MKFFTFLIDTFSMLKIFTVACVLSFTGSVYYKNRFVKAELFIFLIPIRQEFSEFRLQTFCGFNLSR